MPSTPDFACSFISRWYCCSVIIGLRGPRASPTSDRRRFKNHQLQCWHPEDRRAEFRLSFHRLFTPAIDQDIHATFLRQIADSDPTAWHVIIADQAGFHLQADDTRLPANIRLLPLPPYSPELNPVEKLGDLVKNAICNQLFTALRPLEDAILAELEPLRQSGARVAELIGQGWLLEQASAGAPT